MARAEAGTKTQQARELSRMRQRLDDWRKGNARRVAFPEKLWASAGRLARRHGIYPTARALGLEYNKLKRVSGGARQRPAVQKAVKFIDVTGALPASRSSCRLWLQGPGGQRLQVEMAAGAAAEVVLQLCRWGWAAS
jgi:hypothetical protein